VGAAVAHASTPRPVVPCGLLFEAGEEVPGAAEFPQADQRFHVVGVKTPLPRFPQSDRLGDVVDPG